jgi:hypothetical protein
LCALQDDDCMSICLELCVPVGSVIDIRFHDADFGAGVVVEVGKILVVLDLGNDRRLQLARNQSIEIETLEPRLRTRTNNQKRGN